MAVATDLTIDHYARAMASYERELVTPGSRYDQFVSGDRNALTEQERDGFRLFFGKGLCGDCHAGPMLSDYSMRIQGVGDGYEDIAPGFEGKSGDGRDLGRFHADPERFAADQYAFRTLTVRNVDVTAPFFHSGSAATLEDVVDFYNRGGLGAHDISDEALAAAGVQRDPSIRPLGLTDAEVDAIVAFMLSTSAPVRLGPGGMDLTSVPHRVPERLGATRRSHAERAGALSGREGSHPIARPSSLSTAKTLRAVLASDRRVGSELPQLVPQNRLHHLRSGLPAGALHDLPHEEPGESGLAVRGRRRPYPDARR